jgi:predicted NAD/FAD-dependent oxidoreductase/deoxyribodipyrimidine photolyase
MAFPLDPRPDAWLRERVRLEHPGDPRDGRFVLAWVCTALRADDNPLLDAARRAAAKHALPLLVYQGLTHRAWYASDRTHGFILEGARDLAEALAVQGIRYVLHVERGDERGALRRLAADAAMVFAEDFPVGDLPGWRAALARSSGRPLYAVDCACVLPMRVVGRAWERAFAFREATDADRRARLGVTVSPAPAVPAWEGALPFTPTDLSREPIADVLAAMPIDHAVNLPRDLPGGERAARARWDAWRTAHLGTYHTRRTDAGDPGGASELSAHLHFGMISPWRVAAEALAQGGAGAEKFLDELLTWRELAWCFCAHRADHATALPAWATQSLAATRDRRARRPALDAIERGETGDALFDLAQRSLRLRATLHNNVRMTWGRTLAGWFADPAEGLRVITNLNHRYALDGRDPSSYGGILWCYGQFDRAQGDHGGPLGAISARDGDTHLKRYGAGRYAASVARGEGGARCVIVGAGVAGLMAARALRDAGVQVTLLDKGRAPGGRIATRRHDDARYDHGAQFLTARDPRFARHVNAWADAGVLRAWFGEAWCAPGGMSALPRHLAQGLDVRTDVTARAVREDHGRWIVDDAAGGLWEADAVILTAPAPQSLALLDAGGVSLGPALRNSLEGVRYHRCLAGIFDAPWPDALPAHGVAPAGDPLGWLACNRRKGVSLVDALTAHASPAWSEAHWALSDDAVLDLMAAALTDRLGARPAARSLKRWRYARPAVSLDGPAVSHGGALVIAGDAFAPGEGRVEGAALSGLAAAARVAGALRAG